MKKTTLLAWAFILVLGVYSTPADADPALEHEAEERIEDIIREEEGARKVRVEIDVDADVRPGTVPIDFIAFDLNGDGVLARDEVGEVLFNMFDKDGNDLIDNIEMKKVGPSPVIEMEKTVIETVDYYNPDMPEKTKVTTEDFLVASRLIMFDEDKDGLTPLDFLGMSFLEVDVKDDGVIDLYEWKRAYAAAVRPLHIEPYNYNN